MNTFTFGGMLTKKEVTVSDEGEVTVSNKSYGSRTLTMEDIKVIYLRKSTGSSNGAVFLSTTGGKLPDPHASTTGFLYTKKQKRDVETLLELIQGFDPDISIVDDKPAPVSLPARQPATKPKQNKNTMKCPKCKSTQVVFMDNKRKGFSVGKAIGGAALTGGIGSLAGFAGKKGKDRWHCQSCGNVFGKKK